MDHGAFNSQLLLNGTDGESRGESPHNHHILIIDDEPVTTAVVGRWLERAGYNRITPSNDASTVLPLIAAQQPDLVLLDVVMPPFNGLDILAEIRERYGWMPLPVIILTAETDLATRRRALTLGATDFLTKPVDEVELLLRVRNALILKAHHDHLKSHTELLEEAVKARTATLLRAQEEIIHCLAQAGEYRDSDTGRHVIRVGRYAGVIARQLGLSNDFTELLQQAAPLHDVGKIGVPDDILLKPGPLSEAQIAVMREHCLLGKRICEPEAFHHDHDRRSVLPVLRLASEICLTHHERWDGSGYPQGLAGEQIPIAARITAVADAFDAMSQKRAYKAPLPLERCLERIQEGSGTHFDPAVVAAFMASLDQILAVYMELSDDSHAAIAQVAEMA